MRAKKGTVPDSGDVHVWKLMTRLIVLNKLMGIPRNWRHGALFILKLEKCNFWYKRASTWLGYADKKNRGFIILDTSKVIFSNYYDDRIWQSPRTIQEVSIINKPVTWIYASKLEVNTHADIVRVEIGNWKICNCASREIWLTTAKCT